LVGETQAPDHVENIWTRILIFFLIYLGLIFLRGFVLGMYLKVCYKKLLTLVCEKHYHLNAHQILTIYQNRSSTIEEDFRTIDHNLLMSFEIGMSVMFDGMVAVIVQASGQPVYIAIAAPAIILLTVCNLIYFKLEEKLNAIREKYLERFRNYVEIFINKSHQILRFNKIKAMINIYYRKNKIILLLDSNKLLAGSGIRMIAEAIVWVGLVVVLVILIESNPSLKDTPLITIGISLYINMAVSNRFNFKTVNLLETQMVALTRIMSMLEDIPDVSPRRKSKIDAGEKPTVF
jgi:hypothetical protein